MYLESETRVRATMEGGVSEVALPAFGAVGVASVLHQVQACQWMYSQQFSKLKITNTRNHSRHNDAGANNWAEENGLNGETENTMKERRASVRTFHFNSFETRIPMVLLITKNIEPHVPCGSRRG